MAEGCVAKPLEPKDPLANVKVEDIASIELLFARDLITYVMRRRIPLWDFEDRYGGPSPITPFSYRIRNAIDYYLLKEDINIYFLFAKGFSRLPFTYEAFISAANVVMESVSPNVHTPNHLLRLMALLSQYTVLAYKRGVYMAPYYSLIAIQDLLYRYIKRNNLTSIIFFSSLGLHADRLSKEKPIVTLDNLLL